MAHLSDADKKQLLGENYQEAERLAELANTKSTEQRGAEARRDTYEQVRNYALIIAGISAIIVVTNYFQLSGPYQPFLGIATEATVLAGALCASFAQVVIRRNS